MASVEIYIKNYKGPDGTVISKETLLQTIPMTGDPVITNPKVKTDLGKAGSFEFGLELNSPYYDAMMQMKTILRVVYFGETLFRGRVLTIDKGMARSRVVHCEGDLAFLLDSHQVGVKDDARQKTDVLTYLSSVINQHNSDVDDSDKRFILGEAPSSYSDSVLSDQRVDVPADKAEQKFGSSSYDTSMDRLEGLLSDFGGYMRTRYDPSDGTVFLDWLDNYYHSYSGQDIEVASNLIDLSGQTEVSNLFTIVLPIGKKDNGEVFINSWWPKVSPNHPKVDYIKVSELATIPLYSDDVLNSGYHRKEDYANANARFGKIWKPVEFENADTPQKLFNYAKDWIKNNFMPELTQWDVTALDLKYVGSDQRALFTGDRVKLVHPEVDQTFISVTIISAEYDLYNPDKNKFKIGIPNQQINASYGVKQKNSSGAKSVNAGISTDNLQKELESKVNSLLDDLNRDRDILQQQYILKTKYGEDIGLDSPLAFLKYETDCVTERDPETVAKETADVVNKMNYTMMISKDNLVMQALDRTASEFRFNDPIKWNDPKLVIDNTPELKQRQLTFKAQATAHLTQDLGLPDDQALVLLNESIYDTNLAGLVDDDGNWTQEAIDQGALNWNPELKKVIKNAKLAFDESQGKSVAGGIITSAVPFLTGGSLDIANVLHAVESKDPTTGFTDQVVDLLNGGISGKLTELADKTGLSFDFSNILNTSEITDKVTGLTDKAVELLNGGISGKLTELLNGTGFNFDIGNLFNTEQISNTVTGIVNKTVGLVGGLINTEEVKNTVTGIANKAVNFIGGLFSGTSKEKDGSTDVDKGINFLSGLITGSDKQTSATGSKEKALDIINGLLSGSSKEKTGSTDVDKSVDILSGLLTGSDKQTESTGTGSKVFNFLSGVLTGSETGKESTGESNKLVDVLSGLFSGSKTKASSSAEEKTTFFLGNDKAQVDGTTGTASFGDGYEWMVTLNDTVGKENGFISAKDFQAVKAIPSFKTKFGAIDTFVANQATFNSTYTTKLTAVEAYINKINTSSVDADTYVSAGHGSFNSVNVKNGLTANTVTGNSMKIKVAGPNNTSEDADLSLCFSSAVSSFKDGVWTLTLYKIGGGSQDVPFDLTATDWYKNQIAGKYNDGWDAAVDVSNIPEIISSSTEKGTMSASWPYTKTVGSNVTRGTTEMTFRLEVNQNDAFIRVEGDNDTHKDYAHITHNQYKNGQNATKVKKGTWSGTSITFTTDAPTPNANAAQTLTLSWNNDTGWSWDDDNGYQQKYQIKDGNTVVDTVYATIPDMAVGLTEPGTQKSTWWKTSGTNANKYVVPGTSAAAYLATDMANAHPLSSLKTGSDIVITPTEAINAGFKIAHDSITLSQTGSSVVRPGSSTTIYPKALSDAADTSPDNITTISAILTAPTATKTDKVILESTDISNNISKTGVIVHYSDNSTTNGLQVLIDASAVYSAGIAKGGEQGTAAEGTITGINMRTPRGSYSSTEEMFTLNLQATGTDITNAPYNSSVKFAVSGSGLTLTKGSLTNTATDAYSNVYKGRYSVKRNSGGVFKIESIDTITASVTSLPIDLELAPPVKTLDSGGASNWNSEDHKYVYDLTSSLSVDGTATLKRQVKNLELVPTDAIDYGKTLVTVSSVTRTENCVYDIEQETAFDNVIVELSNGKKVVKGVDFSDVYRNAAHGISYAEEQNYTVELIDSEGNYVGEEDFLLNVEDIMYQGNRDATTISRRRYIYSSNGAMVAAYGKTSSLPSASNRIGYIYPNTLVTNLGTATSSSIGVWVQINCEGTSCYLYTTNIDNVLHTSPDSPSNYGNLRGWRYDGQTVTYDYTCTVDTNGASTINIYTNRSTTSTVLATLSNNQNVSCMYLPKNYADEFMPVKIGNTEGYVESKYIVGTNAYLELHPDTPVMQSVIINHVYQNIKLEDNSTYTKSYDVTMKTVLNNSKVVIETEPMTATAYRNITTNIESSELSKYLSRINYFYGKMAVAGITEGIRNHKVEFTVSYSNGNSNTYIAEIEVKNDVQAETYDYYGFVYAYSGKTVNMRAEPSKSSTVVYQVPVNSRIACKYDPAEYAGVEEGDTAEWMPVQYDGYTGYMQAKYIRTTNAYDEDPGGESEDKKPASVTIDRIIYEGTANGSVVVKLKDTSSALPHKLSAVNKTEYMIAARRANAEMATYFDKADDAGHYAWHSHTAPSSSILAIVVCLVVRYQDGVTKDLFIKATSFPH